MREGIDAAVAELTGARPIINDQLDLGLVSGVTAPTLDMRVIKSGRTSEVTHGIITGVEGVRTIPYGGFDRIVRHVVHIAQAPEGGQVSAGGDSGSWWLEEGTNKVVGLHFAGDNFPAYGLAIAIPQVLDALNVDVVT
jgi:endonuclease G